MSILMRSSNCDQTLRSDISFVVRVVVLRIARGEIVHIRHALVRRIVVERERTSGVLERDRSARPLRFLFFGLRVRTTLRFRVGPEVAGAARRRGCEGIERARRAAETASAAAGARAAESARARTTAEPTARTRSAASAGAWTTGAAIFTRARLADGERTAVEYLTIETLNRLLGVGALGELHERESARTAGLSIDGQHDLRGLRDRAKVRSQIRFGCAIGQIPDEQTNSQSTFSLLVYELRNPRGGASEKTRWAEALVGKPYLKSSSMASSYIVPLVEGV